MKEGEINMDINTFWKNFNLGIELDVAGSFIYNGLKIFDDLKSFCNVEEVFEFLYNISVGLERLEKISIILIEHDSTINQGKFEKSFKTHNHINLIKRISKNHGLNFDEVNNNFIRLLSNFYNQWRYDRYKLKEAYKYDKERSALVSFIEKNLNITIDDKRDFNITENSYIIKEFIGKVIGKITTTLYEIIYDEATSQNIYTYEIRVDTKAYKIFIRKEFDFIKETVLWKELLIYILNHSDDIAILRLIKSFTPLEFDSGMTKELLCCFKNDLYKLEYIDMLDTIYEDVKNK